MTVRRTTVYAERIRLRRGAVEFEVIASIVLTVTLAILFAVAVLQYANLRRETDTRRAVELAAAAELDCIRAGLHAVPFGATGAPPELVPGRTVVQATATAGTGRWAGLALVRVTARQQISARRTITVELAAYVAPGGTP